MEQIIDGRRAHPPAVELDRLATRAYALVNHPRLTTRASRVLAAAAAYTAQTSGHLSWVSTLGEDRTVSVGVDQLGGLAAVGLREVSTLGWSRSECATLRAARHLVVAARAALRQTPAAIVQVFGEADLLLDRLVGALDDAPATTCVPPLPEAVGR